MKQEVSSDSSGKRPEEPRLLKAIPVYASCYHELDGFLELVLAR